MKEIFNVEFDDDLYTLMAFKFYNFLVADDMEVPIDLCMKNIVASCLEFDYKEAMFEQCNKFLDMILEQ